ncbi:hypothetical protein [Kitasatospora sp. NPDC057223]|uniref:hypothetical protein n=1 Tax=Kitasatospora sp. NPDC057223 TaxID=3346055 RepID=UPI00362FFEC1
MTGQQVDQPVRITDNGVRSFIPPTFCFELHHESGSLVATVSEVLLAARNVSDFEALELLRAEGLRATGTLSEYDAGPQARQAGLRFTIRNTVAAPG